MRTTTAWLTCVLAGSSLQLAPQAALSGRAADSAAAIERFLSATETPLTSYRAFRVLEASTRGGKMRAQLKACTSLDPVRGFQYSVTSEDGSGVIRKKVLHAALDAERSMRATGEVSKGALTRANYEFTVAQGGEDGLVRIGMRPKRRDTLLVEGSMLLTADDSDLVRVEGLLSKRPSFWTRRVEVTRRYSRMKGIRVPISMQSTAQVLMVGRSTFSMTYEYESINGEAVTEAAAPLHVASCSSPGVI